MMKYVLEGFTESAKTTLETNELNLVMKTMYEYYLSDIYCHVYDGETGEVLAIINCPNYEDYFTSEFVPLEILCS